MARNKTYYYIYKTNNLISGKFYVGMHITRNLDDNYLGSGKRLRNSIRKYGKENFKKEILEFCKDRIELKKREKEIVNEQFLQNPMCMNLQVGGGGGFSSKEHMKKCCKAGNIAFRKKLKEDKQFAKQFSETVSRTNKKMIEEGKFDNFIYSHNWLGKKHTPETIEKMKKSKRGQGLGKNNSQYGTTWITNGIENKKINKFSEIPAGYKKGRII